MASVTKVNVQKDKLIQSVRDRKAEVEAKHAAAVEAYPALLEAWQAEAAQFLDMVKAIIMATGATPSITPGYGGWSQAFPSRPVYPTISVAKYDRDIAMLEMSADPTISVTADDFGVYLR